jgi:hypothetical protein
MVDKELFAIEILLKQPNEGGNPNQQQANDDRNRPPVLV